MNVIGTDAQAYVFICIGQICLDSKCIYFKRYTTSGRDASSTNKYEWHKFEAHRVS